MSGTRDNSSDNPPARAEAVQKLKTLQDVYTKLSDDKIVVMNFLSSFCYACQKVRPKYLKMAAENSEHASFYQVEIGDVAESIQQFDILQIPTFVAFFRKEEIGRYAGKDGDNLNRFLKLSMEERKRRTETGEVQKKPEETEAAPKAEDVTPTAPEDTTPAQPAATVSPTGS